MREFVRLLQVFIFCTLAFFGLFFICAFVWFASGLPDNTLAVVVISLITIGLYYTFYLWIKHTFSKKNNKED
jgi:hypothetical protein